MTAVPTLAQVAAALSKPVDKVTDAYKGEIAAQAAVCRVEAYSDDLARALVRRVARSLAAEGLPLGLQVADFGTTYLGSSDPEVRRLEGPYRKVVLG